MASPSRETLPTASFPRRGRSRVAHAAGMLLFLLSLGSWTRVLAHVDDFTMQLLEDFYYATDGPRWVYPKGKVPWNFSSTSSGDPCTDSWAGLACSPRGSSCSEAVPCVVTGINVTKYGLQGTLPSSISGMVNLTYFRIEKNKVKGLLDLSMFYPMTRLIELHLNENSFSGSFPSDINKMSSLGLLKLRGNKFAGPVPDTFGDLSSLFEVHLSLNRFSGLIPTTLHRLSATLTYLSFRNNAFTGTIPSNLGSLTKLEQLSLYNNSLVGSIPSSLGSLVKLNLLVLHSNHLTGTIPTELGTPKAMGGLYLHRNYLRGTIPSVLLQLSGLIDFDLSTNRLYGSLPTSVSAMTSVHQFRVRDNKLVGRIPEEVRFWLNVTEFDVSGNSLTGSIPSFIANLVTLQKLDLKANQFTGSLSIMDKMKDFPALESVDISSNQFTGPLPTLLFQSRSLEFFDASQNCLSGEIGDFICAGNIQTLSLNGVSSGASCRIKLEDPLNVFQASLTYPIRGRLPKCIIEKPGVIQVYMEGNRIQGDLVGVTVGANLTELGLGSNELQGIVSPSILQHPFRFLDLSYNKFEGNLGAVDQSCAMSVPEINMTRRMAVNRFSDMVPRCYQNLTNIDILSGNHFNCNDDYVLPAEDESSESTICGSRDFELSLLIYVVLFVAGVGFVGCYLYRTDGVRRLLRETSTFLLRRSAWLSLDDTEAPGLRNFGSSVHGILKTSVALGLYIILVSSCISAGLSAGSSLIANSYGWKLSMVMLVGWPVSLSYALLWCSVMAICFYASLLQLVRWQEGADSDGRFLNVDFDALAEMLGVTSNPVLKDAESEAFPDESWAVDSEIGDANNQVNPVNRDSYHQEDEEQEEESTERVSAEPSQVTFKAEAPEMAMAVGKKPIVSIRDSNHEAISPTKSFFEVSLDDAKRAESFFVYKTETIKHEGLKVDFPIIAKSAVVLLANVFVSIILNAFYSIVFFSDLDTEKKLLFQFAFAAVSTAWTKGGVRYSIKKIKSSFRLQVLLNITMNVVNTIVVPCLTMLVTSDYCFYGLFRGLGDIHVAVTYEECVVTTFSNGVVICTERGPAVSVNTFSRPFVYNGGCSQAVLAGYIPVYILSYAIDLVLGPIFLGIVAKYFENFDVIPVPHMLWLSSRTQGYQLLRGHQLYIMMFQHIVMLLTFGIASPILALVIIIGAVADVVLYVYMIRRFLDSAKTRPDEDHTGGLEAASRLIPRNFVHIYISIMWLSALFYGAVLLDYAIEGSFLYVYICFPAAILGIAGMLTGLARHPRLLFDAVIALQRRLKKWTSSSKSQSNMTSPL